ncbi:MAG: YcxB family protein [Pyrinomonadaceae bacterium]
MTIEFELTTQDLLAFNWYHYQHSPAMRSAYRKGYTTIIIFSAFFGMFCAYLWGAQFGLITFIVTLPIYALTYHKSARENLTRTASRMIGEGRNRSVTGRHRVEINKKEITITNEVSRGSVLWVGVERVERTSEHIIIYTAAVKAVVVPLRAFHDAREADVFYATARRYLDIGMAGRGLFAGANYYLEA